MIDTTSQPTFVFEDTKNHGYRYIRKGLLRRGWRQIMLPRRHPSRGARGSYDKENTLHWKQPFWVQRRGALGVASAGQKDVTCPDLVWTLSCGRLLRGLGGLGKGQATNHFERSSCLTTKAGLCRTIQSMLVCGGLESREDIASPSSFFPRCFDLSNPSQVGEFKDDFRQTAAAAVLKVLTREHTTRVPPVSSTDQIAWEMDPGYRSPCPDIQELEGCGAGNSAGIHGWILSLAVRACRRRLLETSGWHEFHAGALSGAHGAKNLETREWDSLLLYSYMLRRAMHPANNEPGSRVLDSMTGKLGGRLSEGEELHSGSGVIEDNPPGEGLRALQGLRRTPLKASIVQVGWRELPRRPSSAPARRQPGVDFSGEQRHSSRDGLAAARYERLAVEHGDPARTICHAAPGGWGEEESKELLDGLSRIWGRSGFVGSTRCTCSIPTLEHGGETGQCNNAGKGHSFVAQLKVEATQLCAALKRKCPQWKIDGESNLWILKPAGASRGQGVRLAWTMDQILHAQKTMGGRVVQKYVESPLLLPPRPPSPRPSTDPPPTDPADPNRGRHRITHGKIYHGDILGADFCGTVRPGKGGAGAGKTGAVVGRLEAHRALGSAVETEPTLPGDEIEAAPFDGSLRGTEDNISGRRGNGEHIDVHRRQAAGAMKFDLRVWVLVKAWKPLEAFVFDECYLRVCPRSFTLLESKFGDPDVHLTNLCARSPAPRAAMDPVPLKAHTRRGRQKRPSSASRALSGATNRVDGHARERGTLLGESSAARSGRRLSDVESDSSPSEDQPHIGQRGVESSVASQQELVQRLGEVEIMREEGGSQGDRGGLEREKSQARGEGVWKNKVFPSIKRIVKSTLLAAQSHVLPRAASFQLFGFDLLLDRDLNPWLLEVNLSPAMSHSCKRQSDLIRSMCEGLLRLTVDHTFPPTYPSPFNDEDESTENNEPENARTTGTGHSTHFADNRSHRFRKWTPIVMTPLPQRDSAASSTLAANATPTVSSCAETADTGVREPSAQNFSVRGQHLTRRGLTRAERGVREAMAATALALWWKPRVEECRETRRRRLRATAVLSGWVARQAARRRRRKLRAKYEWSARLVQHQWRQASLRTSERRHLAARQEACVLVQTAWRNRQLERRRYSRRVRRKVCVGLRRWARVLLHRRRRVAAKAISRAALEAVMRHKQKRKFAAVITKKLRRACNRRRESRLRLQRFARVSCLLPARLAAQKLHRDVRTQHKAATIIAKAFRKAATQSADIRAGSAARTLQEWFWTVRRLWTRRCMSATTIQVAWRRARQRQQQRLSAAVKLQRLVNLCLQSMSVSEVVESSPTKYPAAGVCAKTSSTNASAYRAKPSNLAVRPNQESGNPSPPAQGGYRGVGSLDFSALRSRGKTTTRGHANDATLLTSLSPCTATSTKEGMCTKKPLVAEDSMGSGRSTISGGRPSSPATTVRKNWTASDLSLTSAAASYSGKAGGEQSWSHAWEDVAVAAVEVASGPQILPSSRRKGGQFSPEVDIDQSTSCSTTSTAGRMDSQSAENGGHTGGILSLDCILGDYTNSKKGRRNRAPISKMKGQSQPLHQRQSRDGRHGTSLLHRSQEPEGRRPTSLCYGGRGLAPYPPSWATQRSNFRAPVRRAHRQAAHGERNLAITSARRRYTQGKNRPNLSGNVDGAPPSFACGLLSRALNDEHNESRRGWYTPMGKTRPRSGAGMSSRGRTENRNGDQDTRNSIGLRRPRVSTQYGGESGGVLQMLAQLEAR